VRITVIKQIEWKTDPLLNEGKANLGLGHTAKLWKDNNNDWHWEIYRGTELLKKGWDYGLCQVMAECQAVWENMVWTVLTRE